MRDKLIKLFLATLYISAFTFGGGFVIITLMKNRFVDQLHWLEEDRMMDITALAQSSPGAIAVNAAILVGWHVAGFPGMLVAVLGTILPPVTIMIAVSFFYKAFVSNQLVGWLLVGMQAGVAAVIFDVVIGMGIHVLKLRRPFCIVLMVLALAAVLFFHVNAVFIILAAGLIGLVRGLI